VHGNEFFITFRTARSSDRSKNTPPPAVLTE
jgi:hypothetical protein